MARSLNSYIRSMRRRVHLTQDEVMFLLGRDNHATISRHETDRRIPSLKTVFEYSVVLGQDPRELFAGRYEAVERGIRRRAKVLYRNLSRGRSTPELKAKLRHLDRIINSGGSRGR